VDAVADVAVLRYETSTSSGISEKAASPKFPEPLSAGNAAGVEIETPETTSEFSSTTLPDAMVGEAIVSWL
jgi:hypothetical protein